MPANRNIIPEWIPAAYRQTPDESRQEEMVKLQANSKLQKKPGETFKRKHGFGKK